MKTDKEVKYVKVDKDTWIEAPVSVPDKVIRRRYTENQKRSMEKFKFNSKNKLNENS
jgi:hypothetical protein